MQLHAPHTTYVELAVPINHHQAVSNASAIPGIAGPPLRPFDAMIQMSSPSLNRMQTTSSSLAKTPRTTTRHRRAPMDQQEAGPPPLIHHLSPYACKPLPPLSDGPVELNPCMAYSQAPWVDYDITFPPPFARARWGIEGQDQRGTQRWLFEPTTWPCMRSITIHAPFFDKYIVIHHENHPVVLVWHVLVGIYDALRTMAVERYSYLHERRPNEREIQTTTVSLLGGRSQWMGLSLSIAEPDIWELNTA